MAKYRMPFSQYKACQKMTKNEFSRWLETFAEEMWNQGYTDAQKGVTVIDTSDTMVIDTDETKIRELLLSVPGVGPKLCDKIIDRVYEVCDGYISTEVNDGEQTK